MLSYTKGQGWLKAMAPIAITKKSKHQQTSNTDHTGSDETHTDLPINVFEIPCQCTTFGHCSLWAYKISVNGGDFWKASTVS